MQWEWSPFITAAVKRSKKENYHKLDDDSDLYHGCNYSPWRHRSIAAISVTITPMTFHLYGPQCDQRWVENVCQCGTHRTPLRKGDSVWLCDVKPWCRFGPFRCRFPCPWCRFQALGIPPLPLDASLPAFPGSPYRTLGLLVPLIFSLDSLQPQSPPFHLLLHFTSTCNDSLVPPPLPSYSLVSSRYIP